MTRSPCRSLGSVQNMTWTIDVQISFFFVCWSTNLRKLEKAGNLNFSFFVLNHRFCTRASFSVRAQWLDLSNWMSKLSMTPRVLIKARFYPDFPLLYRVTVAFWTFFPIICPEKPWFQYWKMAIEPGKQTRKTQILNFLFHFK